MKNLFLVLLMAALCVSVNAQPGSLHKQVSNTSRLSLCSDNIVVDSSFEAGSPSVAWTESSTTFGSTLCTTSICGFGNGTGPRTGSWWAWFGGTTVDEEGLAAQTVILPAESTANLTFYLEVPVCDTTTAFTDFLAVIIDATDTVYIANDLSPLCGIQSYTLQTVNLDAYCDGGAHNILFYGHTFAETNFFLDDVSVITCPISTGIADVYQVLPIHLSPNPVTDKLKISFGDLDAQTLTLEIANLIGQSLYTHTLSTGSMAQQDFYIQVAGLLETGIYFLKATSGEKIFSQKLLVK